MLHSEKRDIMLLFSFEFRLSSEAIPVLTESRYIFFPPDIAGHGQYYANLRAVALHNQSFIFFVNS